MFQVIPACGGTYSHPIFFSRVQAHGPLISKSMKAFESPIQSHKLHFGIIDNMEDTSIEADIDIFGTTDHRVHLAAREGNVTVLQAGLSSNPELLDLRDQHGCTPLHCAIRADKPEAVRLLLEKGADPLLEGGPFSGNGGVIDFNDAVTMAAVFGKLEALEALLDSGLQVPVSSLTGAAALNQSDSVRLVVARLLSCRRDFLDSSITDGIHQALSRAAMCWHVETMQYLLHVVPRLPESQKEGDQHALQEAIMAALEDNLCCEFCRDRSSRHRQFLTIRELVAAGGNLSEYSIWYALNPLRATGHRSIQRDLGLLIIAQGVDVSVTNERGITPLAAAAGDWDDDDSLVSALLAAGASMSSDSDGNMPVHHVYQPSILKILLESGATVTSRNRLGWTPLIATAGNNEWNPEMTPENRVEVCRLLLSHGSDINARANNGLTALHRAVASKDNAVARLLLENGADVSLLTEKGQSALHFACMAAVDENSMWGDIYPDLLIPAVLQNIRLLLSHGANLETSDDQGRTPLFYTLRGYVPEAKGEDPGMWATDFGPKEDKHLFGVAVEVCDLLSAEGANVEAQDQTGKCFRSLIDRRGLTRPVVGLEHISSLATAWVPAV
jgi:ankyrin repeat protein